MNYVHYVPDWNSVINAKGNKRYSNTVTKIDIEEQKLIMWDEVADKNTSKK